MPVEQSGFVVSGDRYLREFANVVEDISKKSIVVAMLSDVHMLCTEENRQLLTQALEKYRKNQFQINVEPDLE